MQRLNLTLPTPVENLALDEALLEWAEDENPNWEFLRLWESPQPMVVVGRSSRVEQEVNVAACGERRIPILRRPSGGAAIVAGPGCLMYAVVLSYELQPELKDIRCAHTFVLGRLAEALRPLVTSGGSVQHAGTSDLVIADCGLRIADCENRASQSEIRNPQSAIARKFSGNSLRAKRSHLVYHGTLLYDFDLSLVETCLLTPPHVPEYRDGRSHDEFIMNLAAPRQSLVAAVDRAWPTDGEVSRWPADRVANLVSNRYSKEGWNFEFR